VRRWILYHEWREKTHNILNKEEKNTSDREAKSWKIVVIQRKREEHIFNAAFLEHEREDEEVIQNQVNSALYQVMQCTIQCLFIKSKFPKKELNWIEIKISIQKSSSDKHYSILNWIDI
jgi:mannose-1-phosphate guanylyltransferase